MIDRRVIQHRVISFQSTLKQMNFSNFCIVLLVLLEYLSPSVKCASIHVNIYVSLLFMLP
jgi:hypothetical protein